MRDGSRLVLKRDTLAELGDGQLAGVAAGTVSGITFTCFTFPRTGFDCATQYCTDWCPYTLTCH